MNKQIVILAAGKGARMNSALPKPMHKVENQTMLDRVIKASSQVTSDIILVHSHQMLPYLQDYPQCQLVLQEEQLGTAHAAFCALGSIKKDSFVTLVYSDHPFIDSLIINKLFDHIIASNYSYLTLASIQEQPNTYGRIIANGNQMLKIVEFKDLTPDQQSITLCNAALMSFAPSILHRFLPMIIEQKTSQEYYMTTMAQLLTAHSLSASYIIDGESKYCIGVNTAQELELAQQIAKK